jgi:hypothetical protein
VTRVLSLLLVVFAATSLKDVVKSLGDAIDAGSSFSWTEQGGASRSKHSTLARDGITGVKIDEATQRAGSDIDETYTLLLKDLDADELEVVEDAGGGPDGIAYGTPSRKIYKVHLLARGDQKLIGLQQTIAGRTVHFDLKEMSIPLATRAAADQVLALLREAVKLAAAK